MNKKSAVISGIKNGIFSIIYKLQNRNTEPDVTEEKEQPVDSEPISRSKNKTETHSPDKKELIDLKKELRESIDTILNKLFDGISGLLEDEYKDRLIGFERRIEDLEGEKGKGGSAVFDPKELEKIIDSIETIKSIPKEEIGKIKKTGLIDLSDDKLNRISKVLNYLEQAPEKDIKTIGKIGESKKLEEERRNIEEEISAMGLTGIPPEELESVRLIMSIYGLVPKGNNKVPGSHESRLLTEFLDKLEKRMNRMNIYIFHYEGVMLLKKGAFRNAYKYFNEITTMNQNLKGAWLNRGFALGKLGNIDGEIKCYQKALSIDKKYETALHNMKIAERKNRKSQRRI
jgi:tetratricopeptide (TPR) repeat protein